MRKTDKNKSVKIYNTAQSIADKIEEIQNDAEDLIKLLDNSSLETKGGEQHISIPRKWINGSAFNLFRGKKFSEERIANTGNGPWSEEDIDDLIVGLDNDIFNLDRKPTFIVVGYEVHDLDIIISNIKKSKNTLKIYPHDLTPMDGTVEK